MVKAIDFRLDRSSGPRLALIVTREPDLTSLLRSKASSGPLQGAYIQGPANWDGVVRKGHGGPAYPGRYVWNGQAWIWKEDQESSDRVISSRP
jgi:hypothetical protein